MARNHVEDFWYHLYKPQRGDVIVDVGAGRGETCMDVGSNERVRVRTERAARERGASLLGRT